MNDAEARRSGWVTFGIAVSAAYCATIAAMFWWDIPGKLDIPTAEIAFNALGDFLAGAFAPVAFLWLFIATMVQSQELALQRKELALTRREFEENREVMKAQSDFIGQQTKMLMDARNDDVVSGRIATALSLAAAYLGDGDSFEPKAGQGRSLGSWERDLSSSLEAELHSLCGFIRRTRSLLDVGLLHRYPADAYLANFEVIANELETARDNAPSEKWTRTFNATRVAKAIDDAKFVAALPKPSP